MARKRRAKATRRRLPEPLDVLEGRVEPRAEDLFDLIHRVNPTKLALPEAEAAERYRLKSRLQSLLIRRFGDSHLAVEGGDGEVVSLAHRAGLRDACHAPLSELEPDARSWVRFQLDLGSAPGEEAGVEPAWSRTSEDRDAGGEVSAEALVGRAREAVDGYDYQTAEDLLRRALAASGGSPEAARPLLELLVGVLGMDREALELEPRLAASAREDPSVRVHLALAAARGGEGGRARGLVRGVELARSVDVHVALAEEAIRDRDRREAKRCLAAVTEGDPTHPRIQDLAAAIAELRAEDFRPAEDALRERYREHGALAVEEEARALAERWPRSELARHVLREIARERRRASAARNLEAGDRAFAEGRFRKAARCFRAALEDGSDRADLPGLIDDAERKDREQDDARRLERLAQSLREGVDRDELLAYLELPRRLRAAARERLGVRALGWLETLKAPSSGSRAQAAVTAVLALERATAALESGDADAAHDLLEPHLKELRGVEEARQVFGRARARRVAERRERASSALRSAREALDSGDLETAGARLAEVHPGDLPAGERAGPEELRARLEHGRTIELLSAEVDRQAAAGDYLGALVPARRLRELAAGEDERRSWDRAVAELKESLRTAWQLEVADGPAPGDELVDLLPPGTHEKPSIWLGDGGRELLLLETRDHWLFLRFVDLEHRRVATRLSLRTPEFLGSPISVSLEGRRIWIVGSRGIVLELRRGDPWEIRRCRPLAELLPERTEFRMAARSPGVAELWIEVGSESEEEEWTTRVVDLEAWRLGRELPRSWALPILGLGEPRTACAGLLRGARLCTPQGTPVPHPDLPLGGQLRSAAVAPDGRGLVLTDLRGVLGDEEDEAFVDLFYPRRIRDGGEGVFLVWAGLDPETGTYEPRTSRKVAGVDKTGTHPLATSLDRGLVFQLLEGDDLELVARRCAGDELEEVYRVTVPPETGLAVDRDSRRVVAIGAGPRGLQVFVLGEEPPPFEPLSVLPDDVPRPSTQPPFDCGPHILSDLTEQILAAGVSSPSSDAPAGDPLSGDLLFDDLLSGDLPSGGVLGKAELGEGKAWLLALAYLALDRSTETADREQLRVLVKRIETPETRDAGLFLAACVRAKLGEWQEVHKYLRILTPETLSGSEQRHYWHLLGIARLHEGRTEEALAAFEKGGEFPGSCALAPLVDLTRPLAERPETREPEPRRSLVRQLLDALRRADRALEAGDLEQARTVLERPAILQPAELQTTARRAWIALRTPAETPLERFFKRWTLALLSQLQNSPKARRRQILLPGLSWDADRLAELEAEARAWLEGA